MAAWVGLIGIIEGKLIIGGKGGIGLFTWGAFVGLTGITDGKFIFGRNEGTGGGVWGATGRAFWVTGAWVGLIGMTDGKFILGINDGTGGGVGREQSSFWAPFSQQYGSLALGLAHLIFKK